MGGSHSKRILKNLDLVDLKQIVQNDVFQKLDFTKAQVGDNDLFLDLDYIDMKRAHDTHTLINLDLMDLKVVVESDHNSYLSKIYNKKVYIMYCYVNRICYNIFRSV